MVQYTTPTLSLSLSLAVAHKLDLQIMLALGRVTLTESQKRCISLSLFQHSPPFSGAGLSTKTPGLAVDYKYVVLGSILNVSDPDVYLQLSIFYFGTSRHDK